MEEKLETIAEKDKNERGLSRPDW